jgi:SAM-dependent methyltransferase
MSPVKTESETSAYDEFAWFYDRHWVTEVGEHFLAAVERALLPNLASGARILDLCCGTGQLAANLNLRGYSVTGVDSSSEMLRLARSHAPDAQFLLGDARSFIASEPFDAAVCVFDSINHFLDLREVEAVFRTARQALRPGGQFLFDVNSELAFREHWEDHYSIVEADHVCVLTGGYDDSSRRAHYDITLFRQRDGAWWRTDTRIEERCYDLDEIGAAILNAGFTSFEGFAADAELGLEEHTGRVFFLCS